MDKAMRAHKKGPLLPQDGVVSRTVAAALPARCFAALTWLAVLPFATPASGDTLDLVNCCEQTLDDSVFAEPVVRDQRDASFGALANPALRPLGGGEGYDRLVQPPPSVHRPLPVRMTVLGAILPRAAVLVRTADQLRGALLNAGTAGKTIYIDDHAEIDLSFCTELPERDRCKDDRRSGPDSCSDFSLAIPANVTLASGRGRPHSRGALLFSHTFTDCPLLDVQGAGVRITGLRLHGPDSSIENDDPIHCKAEASAIAIKPAVVPQRWATEIDNNEISAWPNAGVDIVGAQAVRVHHNVFQYNRRREHNGTCDHDYGLGYGVQVGPGSVEVKANVFDHNRHDIASNGAPGAYYTASYNLVLTGAVEHSLDVHGGKDHHFCNCNDGNPDNDCPDGDCTNVAGSAFVIQHNTFLQSHKPAVRLRGIPIHGAWIDHNETHDGDAGDAFTQVNAHGNFHARDNRTGVNYLPAWYVSFGGGSHWQWRQFDKTPMGSVAAGDFDGDGAADVMRVTATGWQWSRSGREGWAFLNALTDPLAKLRLGDFVGSARTDVVRATGSEWQVSEGGMSGWRRLFMSTAPLASAAIGDFEGDGHADLFFADGSEWRIIQSFSPLVTRHYSQQYRLSELRFGKFAGDSKLDVVRSNGSEWLVWEHGNQTWRHLNNSSISLAKLVFADFNGDGITDIARSDHGQWQVSWSGRSPWSVLNTSDIDLPSQLIADLDGDGKADVLSRQSPAP